MSSEEEMAEQEVWEEKGEEEEEDEEEKQAASGAPTLEVEEKEAEWGGQTQLLPLRVLNFDSLRL